MAELRVLGFRLGQVAAGATAAFVVIGGGAVWWSSQAVVPKPETPAATVAAVAEKPEPAAVEPAATAAAEPATEPAAEVAAEPAVAAMVEPEPPAPTALAPTALATPPSFDVVRVDADGNALIAGQAAAGSVVSLRIDQTEAANVAVDAQGKFVAMFTIAPAEVPRTLSLMMTMADGNDVPGDKTVILAPTPVRVAKATELLTTDTAAVEPAAEAVGEPVGVPATQPEIQPAAPAVLMADETGVKVVQPPADAITDNVVIDTISYDQKGTVLLAGRGTGGSTLQLYLDNAPLVATRVANDGTWATPLPEVDQGIHTLRVDQIDAAGTVTSRFETPFKREDPAALAALAGQAEPAAAVAADPAAPAVVATAETPAAEPAAEVAAVEPAPTPDPAATEPVTDEAATTEPATTEPAATEAAAAEPAATEPAATEPAATEPAVDVAAAEPAAAEPAAAEPAAPEPATTEPTATKPAAVGVAATEPSATDPAAAEPAAEPAATAAATPELVTPELVTPELVTPEPAAAEEVLAEDAPAVTADTATQVAPAVVADAAAPAVTAGEAVTPGEVATVTTPATEPQPEPVVEGPRVTVVTVQPGFTLWRIASEAYGHGVMYVEVYDANKDKIRNPDLIYPGQVFLVPAAPDGGN